jgi:hypothetical protein
MKSTKITNILLFFVLTSLAFSCNKPSPAPSAADPRDAFVGKWKGSSIVTFEGAVEQTGETNLTISKDPTKSNKILLDALDDDQAPLGATVNGNTFTLDQFTLITDFGTIDDQPTVFNGTGKVNGSNLKIDMIYKAVVDNQQVGGTFKIDATKQ